jgi:hypothetical protein
MDILFLLLFVGVFGAWGVWVTLRTRERKDAGESNE